VKDFEAVVGVFTTRAAATKAVGELDAKGISGFKVEGDGRAAFEVEQPFTTLAAAKAEAGALLKDGFKAASVERS
jgi:hypothetical protein